MVSCLFQLDLGNIKERYQHMYGKTLFQKVKSETSGDYRKLLLAIIGGVLFGFALGTWFSVAMIGLSGASILWQTQNVVRRYPIGSHVAASIALFTSLMTMFWYVLRLLMSRD